MHGISHLSGLDIGSLGEYLFPADLTFVVYRKLKISRIMLRELGSNGEIPGLVKSSW